MRGNARPPPQMLLAGAMSQSALRMLTGATFNMATCKGHLSLCWLALYGAPHHPRCRDAHSNCPIPLDKSVYFPRQRRQDDLRFMRQHSRVATNTFAVRHAAGRLLHCWFGAGLPVCALAWQQPLADGVDYAQYGMPP